MPLPNESDTMYRDRISDLIETIALAGTEPVEIVGYPYDSLVESTTYRYTSALLRALTFHRAKFNRLRAHVAEPFQPIEDRQPQRVDDCRIVSFNHDLVRVALNGVVRSRVPNTQQVIGYGFLLDHILSVRPISSSAPRRREALDY